MPLTLKNREARSVLLDLQGLARPRRRRLSNEELMTLIRQMGYVQLDTINTVERAHHMILFSRNQTYRHHQLKALLEQERTLFEGFTHDACVIPIDFYPHWRHRQRRTEKRIFESANWQKRLGPEPKKTIKRVMTRIREEGPLMSRDFDDASDGRGSWWGWGPSKAALECQWHAGKLAVTRRDGFQKVYDLTERVIPEQHRTSKPSQKETLDWKCRAALERLGFASCGEIARFWNSTKPAQVSAWAAPLIGNELIEIDVIEAGGAKRSVLAFADIEERLTKTQKAPKALRFLSPFDPLIRDRQRLERIFGFDYRIEIFVPEKNRKYGYYVLPIIEGDRLTGRADLKVHRKEGILEMKGLWLEPKVKLTPARQRALSSELERLAKFTGAQTIHADPAFKKAKTG
jgi:uncharacterized protein YcaQ